MNKFDAALASNRTIVLDGGLATQLETMGFDLSGHLWSAQLLADNADAIVAAHRAYLDAGAECIISASYQASRQGFADIGKNAAEADELIAASVRLALAARQSHMNASAPTTAPLVAASVGPYGAILHDGSEYTGRYGVDKLALRSFHASRLAILDCAGADVLAVETIPNRLEAEVLAELLLETRTPAWIAFSCRDSESLQDGSSLAAAGRLFHSHPGVRAIGVNCTPPRYVAAAIPQLREAAPDKAIVVYPNSGETYHAADNSWSGIACDLDTEFDIQAWRAAGARLIGGCCRTGPGDIARIKACL